MNPKNVMTMGKALLVWMVLIPGSGAVLAQTSCPSDPGRFSPSGDEVLDRYTGLVWKRCSQGQAWSGSDCNGTTTTHTHEQSMIVAGQATGGWRLPNIRELSTLADFGCYSSAAVGLAAIDQTAFPRTPRGLYWSTTPWNTGNAWMVVFDEGNAQVYNRGNSGYVRLVRSTP